MKKNAFKLTICFVLIISLSFVALANPTTPIMKADAKSISEMQSELEELRKQQQASKDKADSISDDIKDEAQKQAAVQSQIDSTQKLVFALNNQINLMQDKIDEETAKINKQEADIQQGITDLKQRLRTMYISGNTSMASILLGSDDFFEMLMRMELVNRIADKDKEMIDNLLELKSQYEQTKKDFESDKKTLETSKTEYTSTLASLNKLYDQSQDIIDMKQKEITSIKNMTAEQEQQMKEAEDDINAAIEEERKKQEAASNANSNNNPGGGSSSFNGTFTWPLPGYSYLSTYYGWDILNGEKRWHSGIDITGANVTGKPIVASAAGKVIIAKNDGGYNGGFGNYVVIMHDDTYSTLYAHASSVAVSVGDTVRQGQTIAYVGNTGYSFGAHLHFEIRVGADRVDPLKYLNR